MARFIPIKQMQALREAARSGDERAKQILAMQLSDTEDFSSLLEKYFAPKQEEANVETDAMPNVVEAKATERTEESPFEMYLRENEITLDDKNREEVIREFEEMTGNKVEMPTEEKHEEEEIFEEVKEDPFQPLIDDEVEAVEGYNKYLNELLPSDMCEEKKAFISSRIEKIIDDEKQHIEILKELQHRCSEKEEEVIE